MKQISETEKTMIIIEIAVNRGLEHFSGTEAERSILLEIREVLKRR